MASCFTICSMGTWMASIGWPSVPACLREGGRLPGGCQCAPPKGGTGVKKNLRAGQRHAGLLREEPDLKPFSDAARAAATAVLPEGSRSGPLSGSLSDTAACAGRCSFLLLALVLLGLEPPKELSPLLG